MFLRFGLLVLTLSLGAQCSYGQAGRTYPLVYGPTGRPYGPTQADYQYLRQNGRPWYGHQNNGGGHHHGGGGHHGYYYSSPSYFPPPLYWGGGYGYGGYGFGGPAYVFPPSTAYYGTYGATGYYVNPYVELNIPTVPSNPVPTDPNFPLPGVQNGGNGVNNNNNNPQPPPAAVVEPSDAAAQQRSLKFQVEGDQQLRQLNYLAAAERYRNAIEAARDRAEPRALLALTLAARSRFLEAIDQYKLAIQLDPDWPNKTRHIDDILGLKNDVEKTRIEQRIAEWVELDIRDPNRLFLLATIMHLDGDPRAETVLVTAMLLAGNEPHLVALSNARLPVSSQVAANAQEPNAQQPQAGQGAAPMNQQNTTPSPSETPRSNVPSSPQPRGAGSIDDQVIPPAPPAPPADADGDSAELDGNTPPSRAGFSQPTSPSGPALPAPQ